MDIRCPAIRLESIVFKSSHETERYKLPLEQGWPHFCHVTNPFAKWLF